MSRGRRGARLIRRTRTDVVPSLVDKALGSVRAGTKKKGAELCCMYVEVENSGEGVVVSYELHRASWCLLISVRRPCRSRFETAKGGRWYSVLPERDYIVSS